MEEIGILIESFDQQPQINDRDKTKRMTDLRNLEYHALNLVPLSSQSDKALTLVVELVTRKLGELSFHVMGTSPISIAASHTRLEAVKFFIGNGFSVNREDWDAGDSPLVNALDALYGYQLNNVDPESFLYKTTLAIINLLLEKGATIDTGSHSRESTCERPLAEIRENQRSLSIKKP